MRVIGIERTKHSLFMFMGAFLWLGPPEKARQRIWVGWKPLVRGSAAVGAAEFKWAKARYHDEDLGK
jgi:hypothetical protein